MAVLIVTCELRRRFTIIEVTNRYRAKKRQRRRHRDRLEWLMQKTFLLSYGIAVVGIVLVLYDTYPLWAILLGLPLVLIASLGCAGFVWMPFTVPIILYQWVIDRIYAEEKSGAARLYQKRTKTVIGDQVKRSHFLAVPNEAVLDAVLRPAKRDAARHGTYHA